MKISKNFESFLLHSLDHLPASNTKAAMKYSLMNGGKRIRPLLVFSILDMYGVDEAVGYPFAAALEMVHTYSLIHDDLPAMDNDELRRGKPTCHIAFGEATAILAGDGLLTESFLTVLKSDCDDRTKVKLVQNLAKYAGASGMVYGQDLDMQAEKNTDVTLDDLLSIDEFKTANLLICALRAGAILAGHEEDLDTLTRIGYISGIQFQMIDDILDVCASSQQLGKSTSDIDNGKVTAVSLLGLEKAKQKVQEYQDQLDALVKSLAYSPTKLKELLAYLLNRTF